MEPSRALAHFHSIGSARGSRRNDERRPKLVAARGVAETMMLMISFLVDKYFHFPLFPLDRKDLWLAKKGRLPLRLPLRLASFN